MEHRYVAVLIALDLAAGHAVGPAQAHFAPNVKRLNLFGASPCNRRARYRLHDQTERFAPYAHFADD